MVTASRARCTTSGYHECSEDGRTHILCLPGPGHATLEVRDRWGREAQQGYPFRSPSRIRKSEAARAMAQQGGQAFCSQKLWLWRARMAASKEAYYETARPEVPPPPEERQLQRPQGDRQEFSTAPEPGNTEGRGRVSILPLESGADLQLQAQVRPQLPHMDWSRHPSALVGHSWSHSTFREGSET